MMAYNKDEGITTEELKERVDIVDVIGSVVALKKAGANYKGLCPFHNEKTPSFMVSESRQIFNCFGFGEKGDVYTFIERYYGLDFPEAAEKLADMAGVTLKRNRRGPAGADRLLELNRQAAIFFYKALRQKGNPGLEYMTGRGISADTLHEFGIGWADGRRTSLRDHLASLGYTDREMEELGLISGSGTGNVSDKFRERVMFPIMNTSGKIVGFGGRVLGDGIPKYMNSNESPVFRKKYNLYGLNVTRRHIQNEDTAILVEGYMDVISLCQAGVKNVSASLGTALTENQADMLRRYTGNIVLSYDSDDAGRRAADRGMDILRSRGCDVKVLTVPDGKDPDEYVKKHGREAYMDLVRTAAPYAEYKLMRAGERFDKETTEGRLGFLREAVSILRRLSPLESDIYIKKLAAETDISEGAIRAEMGRAEENRRTGKAAGRNGTAELLPEERELIKILLTKASYVEKEKDFAQMFKSGHGAGILNAIREVYEPGSEIDTGRLMDLLGETDQTLVRGVLEDEILKGDADEMYGELMMRYETGMRREKEKELLALISMAEDAGDPEKVRELMRELMEIQKGLNTRRK